MRLICRIIVDLLDLTEAYALALTVHNAHLVCFTKSFVFDRIGLTVINCVLDRLASSLCGIEDLRARIQEVDHQARVTIVLLEL